MTRPAGWILDYGNVLSRPQDQRWFDPAAARIGTTADTLRSAYWQHRQAYDGGLPTREYWQRVLATVGSGRAVDALDLAWLIEQDVASWLVHDDAVWALAAEFRARGGRTALLSNSGPEVVAKLRSERPIDRLFDAVVISCEVGLSKPDPRIYRHCLARLGLEPPQALFVDDRADNIEGAARIGLRTLQFDGPDALARLRALVG
jgi:putative hydrolase of the HAD superfamily